MNFTIILTEGSLVFQIILIMVYFHKQQFNDARSKLYKYLLISTFIFSFFQFSMILTLKYIDTTSNILKWIPFSLWRLQWGSVILWWGLFYFYTFTVSNKIKSNKVKDVFKYNKFTKIITILMIILTIVAIVVPKSMKYDYESYENFSYVPGIIKILMPIFSLIVTGLVIITAIKNRKNLDKSEKITFAFIAIDTVLTLSLQVTIDYISFSAMGLVLDTIFLYSLVENPDIKVMNEINSAQGDIEKSSRTKTDFLSNMTSEIKVPMNLISSLCDELTGMTTFDEKTVRDEISQIVSSGNSLIEIINNILDISKIETGGTVIQEKDYKLKDLLTDAVNIAKSKLGNKQVKLIIDIDQNISSVLNGDYSKLYQALVNVLTNAVQYTEVGKITFTLTSTKSSGMEHLLFKVSDTGNGIKDEDQSKIFIKGAKIDKKNNIENEGGGLGLAITKEYIEELKGKIWFESKYRVGSMFYIDVQQKIVDSTPLGNAMNEQTASATIELLDCSKFTALIVDDNQLNIKVAKRLLEKYKFNVESVMSGKDCIYKIKEGNHYDVIFMDHMMPEMDGIETLHVLQKLDGYTLPPIVALTANAVAGMKEMYLNEGFNEYLSKPINTKELDRIINLFFKNK